MRGKRGTIQIPYGQWPFGQNPCEYREQEVMIYGPFCVNESEPFEIGVCGERPTYSISLVSCGLRIYKGHSRRSMLRAASRLADDPIIAAHFRSDRQVDELQAATTPEIIKRYQAIIGLALLATKAVREGTTETRGAA